MCKLTRYSTLDIFASSRPEKSTRLGKVDSTKTVEYRLPVTPSTPELYGYQTKQLLSKKRRKLLRNTALQKRIQQNLALLLQASLTTSTPREVRKLREVRKPRRAREPHLINMAASTIGNTASKNTATHSNKSTPTLRHLSHHQATTTHSLCLWYNNHPNKLLHNTILVVNTMSSPLLKLATFTVTS